MLWKEAAQVTVSIFGSGGGFPFWCAILVSGLVPVQSQVEFTWVRYFSQSRDAILASRDKNSFLAL